MVSVVEISVGVAGWKAQSMSVHVLELILCGHGSDAPAGGQREPDLNNNLK